MLLWFFICFCLITLILALRASGSIQNLRHYLVGSQNFSSFTILCTITASFVGGGVVLGTAEKTFQYGIGHAIALLGFALQIFLTGWLIAPRMTRFRKMLSVGQLIGHFYGKHAQVITGLLWLSFCIGIITAQMSAMGSLLTVMIGLDRSICILISSTVVIAYCFFGGIRAIIATDVLQFTLLVTAIVSLCCFGVYKVGGIEALSQNLPENFLSPTYHLSWLDISVIFCSFLLGDALIPPVFQRLIMGKNSQIASKAYIRAGLLIIPICIFSGVYGLIAKVLFPNAIPHEITVALFQQFLPTPLAVVVMIGFMSVIMSSADSYLNAAAGSLLNDLILPYSPINFSQKTLLKYAKYCTLIIGACAMYFAMSVQDILDILLKTYEFWGPIMVVPLLFIIFKKQLPCIGFYASIVTGGSVVVVWNLFNLQATTHVSALVPGIVLNALVTYLLYLACWNYNTSRLSTT